MTQTSLLYHIIRLTGILRHGEINQLKQTTEQETANVDVAHGLVDEFPQIKWPIKMPRNC